MASRSELTLASLPTEILDSIVDSLPTNKDIKNLRLTCKGLGYNAVQLRLSRVFISASKFNIHVMRAIANHEQLRHQVTEVVWDDARFIKEWTGPEYEQVRDDSSFVKARPGFKSPEPRGHSTRPYKNQPFPEWFGTALDYNTTRPGYLAHRLTCMPEQIAERCPADQALAEQCESELPLQEAWNYYEDLLEEQDEVLNGEPPADVDALKYAISCFPNLRRITLTPVAHGLPFLPLYRTPQIRNFPYGFNYPIPRSWPDGFDGCEPPNAPLWQSDETKDQYRGLCVITQLLANGHQCHSISELSIDVRHLDTGLTYHFFDDVNPEYQDLCKILGQPGFRRLDLCILGGDSGNGEDWTASSHKHLRHALSLAELEHFSLRTNANRSQQPWLDESNPELESYRPLDQIVPVDAWPGLQHFGLSGLVVDTDDLVALLARLPLTIRSIELSFLAFKVSGGSYLELLEKIRDTLGWDNRHPTERPRIILGQNKHQYSPGQAFWFSKEATQFVYGERERLFGEYYEDRPSTPLPGDYDPFPKMQPGDPPVFPYTVPLQLNRGGVSLDEFDPSFSEVYSQ